MCLTRHQAQCSATLPSATCFTQTSAQAMRTYSNWCDSHTSDLHRSSCDPKQTFRVKFWGSMPDDGVKPRAGLHKPCTQAIKYSGCDLSHFSCRLNKYGSCGPSWHQMAILWKTVVAFFAGCCVPWTASNWLGMLFAVCGWKPWGSPADQATAQHPATVRDLVAFCEPPASCGSK